MRLSLTSPAYSLLLANFKTACAYKHAFSQQRASGSLRNRGSGRVDIPSREVHCPGSSEGARTRLAAELLGMTCCLHMVSSTCVRDCQDEATNEYVACDEYADFVTSATLNANAEGRPRGTSRAPSLVCLTSTISKDVVLCFGHLSPTAFRNVFVGLAGVEHTRHPPCIEGCIGGTRIRNVTVGTQPTVPLLQDLRASQLLFRRDAARIVMRRA